jgi:hypothetical protein
MAWRHGILARVTIFTVGYEGRSLVMNAQPTALLEKPLPPQRAAE